MVEAKCSLKALVMVYQAAPFHVYQTMPLHITDDNNCQLPMWGLQRFYLVIIMAGAEVYDALRLATYPG